MRDYAGQMARRIRREQRQGTASPGVDADQVARMILLTSRVSILDHLAHGDPGSDIRLADTLGRVFWLAVYGTAQGD